MVLLGRIEVENRLPLTHRNRAIIYRSGQSSETAATKRCYEMRRMNHLRQSKNGHWEVRVVVPVDCRARIGKSNLTRRLGKVSKSEANRLAVDIVREFKAEIEKARRPLPPLLKLNPNRAIAALGRWRDEEIIRVRVDRFNSPRDSLPSEPAKVSAWIKRSGDLIQERHLIRQRLSAGMLRQEHDAKILRILGSNGMDIEADHPAMSALRNSFSQMLLAVMDAEDAARFGEYGSQEEVKAASPISPLRQRVTTTELIDGYAAERQPPDATLARWRRMFAALEEFVGHDDANRYRPENIVDWKASLLSRGLSSSTVKSGYLAGVKAVFAWGFANRKIIANPASGVSVYAPRKTKLREKGFTPDEAKIILLAADTFASGKATPLGVRARRWIPWLCAYTGARVNELTQLRRSDVSYISGHWVIRITPDAGPVKNRKARLVPIHSHLIDKGFIEMVKAAADGPSILRNRHKAAGGCHAYW